MLYNVVNPPTVVTAGSIKAALQVFDGAVIAGAVGKITVLTILLTPHNEDEDVAFAAVAPHAAVSTYSAVIV